jgi:hypothetical protein
MFPIDLLSRVVDAIIAAIATNSTDVIMSQSRWRDSSRKFARELLIFYEDLKRYNSTANLIVFYLERLESTEPSSWEYTRLFDEINKEARDLGQIMGSLMSRFVPDLRGEEVRYTGRWQPSKRALRRGIIMEIYDPQLIELARASYMMDDFVAATIAEIDNIHFDKERNEVRVNLANDYDITTVLPYVKEYLREPAAFLDNFPLAEDREILPKISQLIRYNISVVEQLRQKIQETFREHFTIEDVL